MTVMCVCICFHEGCCYELCVKYAIIQIEISWMHCLILCKKTLRKKRTMSLGKEMNRLEQIAYDFSRIYRICVRCRRHRSGWKKTE